MTGWQEFIFSGGFYWTCLLVPQSPGWAQGASSEAAFAPIPAWPPQHRHVLLAGRASSLFTLGSAGFSSPLGSALFHLFISPVKLFSVEQNFPVLLDTEHEQEHNHEPNVK